MIDVGTKLMTSAQLAMWLSQGNGVWRFDGQSTVRFTYSYNEAEENTMVDRRILVRRWGSKDWVKPTLSVFSRHYGNPSGGN